MLPGATLRQAALLAMERALNQALSWDPASRDALGKSLARPVVVNVTQPAMSFCLIADDQAIRVQHLCGEDPSLTIDGTLLGLMALALGDRTPLQQGRVTMDGDATVAGRLQSILETLELDWEGALAGVIGDIPAHFLARQLRRSLQWGRDAHVRLGEIVEEYLHEESPSLPGRNETEAFFEDIADLRLATDRLAARIDRLHSQNTTTTGQESP